MANKHNWLTQVRGLRAWEGRFPGATPASWLLQGVCLTQALTTLTMYALHKRCEMTFKSTQRQRDTARGKKEGGGERCLTKTAYFFPFSLKIHFRLTVEKLIHLYK